jgi:hypothetical protein
VFHVSKDNINQSNIIQHKTKFKYPESEKGEEKKNYANDITKYYEEKAD